MAEKALIAMSGGVDSSVACYLMKERGYDVRGVTLRLFDNDMIACDMESSCCSLSDVQDAESVCHKLGVPFNVYNFTGKFEESVIRRFVEAYEEGSTPNPCIDCNKYIKFGWLYQRLTELGYDYVVTGHYARVEFNEESGRYDLLKSADPGKDQTYVLAGLTQEQLAHTMFPLGALKKSETRKIAEEQGFINFDKRDSQDICFAPDGDYAGFIERYTGKEYPPGDFVDLDGNVLGTHKGMIHYTIGQRKGLGLALPEPMYVVEKDMAENRVILGRDSDLFSKELTAGEMNWIAFDAPKEPFHATCKIRYSQKEAPATITPLPGDPEGKDCKEGSESKDCKEGSASKDCKEGSDSKDCKECTESKECKEGRCRYGEKIHVEFDEPVRAVTKGQAIVIYDGDKVVAGGTIE